MDKKEMRARVERVLPAVCQLMAIEGLKTENYEVREDIRQPLVLDMAKGMQGLSAWEKEQVGIQAYDTAKHILFGEDGSYRQLLLTACMFAVKLVDEGIEFDPQSQPVLCGLAMIEEAKQDPQNEWGYDQKKLAEAGGRVLTRANLLGLFQNKSLYMH